MEPGKMRGGGNQLILDQLLLPLTTLVSNFPLPLNLLQFTFYNTKTELN